MSKGSNQRPRQVSKEEWDRNHARTFGHKEKASQKDRDNDPEQ